MRSCIPTARTWGCPTGRWATPRWDTSISVRAALVYQDLVKINRACKDGSIMENAEVKAAFEYAKAKGVNVHFMGLVSDGGVHSSIDHLYKLCDIAKTYGIEHTYVHCFMDGRDTDPHSGKGFLFPGLPRFAAGRGRLHKDLRRMSVLQHHLAQKRLIVSCVDAAVQRFQDLIEAESGFRRAP